MKVVSYSDFKLYQTAKRYGKSYREFFRDHGRKLPKPPPLQSVSQKLRIEWDMHTEEKLSNLCAANSEDVQAYVDLYLTLEFYINKARFVQYVNDFGSNVGRMAVLDLASKDSDHRVVSLALSLGVENPCTF